MHGEELVFVKEAFDTNWVAPLGKNVDEFENEVASYIGKGYAVALSSGTAALHLAYKRAGIGPGDVVLCSDLTFSATVNPISYESGIQVFVDSERDTWNMCPYALEEAFNKYPGAKAVAVAHLYGIPANIDRIRDICGLHKVPLIEDAAESMGALYRGKQTGSFGEISVLSFNGNKIITTSGGGMLLTNCKETAEKARFWATQARDPAAHYQHSEIGYNYRMSNIVAGIGRGQMMHLNAHVSAKKRIYETYRETFDSLPITMNPYLKESEPNFWLSCFTINTDCDIKPSDVINALAAENIESRPIWKPMHMQPVFAGRDFISVSDEPVSEDIFLYGLCLPSDIKMSGADMERVIDCVKNVFR
jgi:dTDP-4-amino-4,6-dideoxygalactose transaminase